MKTKLIFIAITYFAVFGLFAQNNLNDYKYIIVPNKFDFQKTENSYRLNELSQFLFNKYGFIALMEGSGYPEDLSFNGCLALRSDVLKETGMFTTKLKVVLKDCSDKVVYTSKIGESREKEYHVAYNKAIRDAFTSFETLNYSYKPSKTSVAKSQTKQVDTNIKTTKEIEKLKEEIKTLKEKKKTAVVEKVTPISENVIEEKVESAHSETSAMASGVLYAQAIKNGFQLVDSTPKVVFKIQKTGLENVFLVVGKNGIIYKKGGEWVLEHYQEEIVHQQKLNIKF